MDLSVDLEILNNILKAELAQAHYNACLMQAAVVQQQTEIENLKSALDKLNEKENNDDISS